MTFGSVSYVAAALVVLDAVFHLVPVPGGRPALWWPPWLLLGALLCLDLPTTRRLARLVRVETGKLLQGLIARGAGRGGPGGRSGAGQRPQGGQRRQRQ